MSVGLERAKVDSRPEETRFVNRAEPPSRAPGRGLTFGLTALLCLIWGSTWLVIRTGLNDLPPLSAAGTRFALAAVVFSALAPALRTREGGEVPPLWLSVCMATLTFAVPYGLVYVAETEIPSGLTSVIWAVFPMMVAICGHYLLPGERLRPRHWYGFATGFLGVAVLFLTDLRDLGPGAVKAGALLLLSPLTAAVGQTLVKRHGARISSTLLNRNGLIGSALLLLAGGVVLERGEPMRWTGPAIFSVAYLSIVGTVLSFGLFFWLLRYAPAHKLSLIAYVIPVIALALGWSVGQESVGLRTLAGSALVLSGVTLVARTRGHSDLSSNT
jgi:drug/metabolite transporter (DMT)-like permease